MSGRTKIFLIVAFLFAILVGLIVLYFYNPMTAGFYPRCPSKMLTGYDCPGCGTLRSTHALMHGRFVEAWHFNPATIIAFVLVPLMILGELHRNKKIAARMPVNVVTLSRHISKVTRHSAFGLTIFLIIICWTILRNIIKY